MSESTYNSYIHGGQISPLVISIPSGQWSGSGSDYYISVTASNITADAILVPYYDKDSSDRLKGHVWCVPGSGSFTIHTTGIPTGTVIIMIQFIGIMGEAQYQVLSDVYSKSQTDALVAQSTANRLLYVDASLTLANDSSAPKEYEIALSSYVPSGYVIQGVTACVKSGSAYYSLPWTDNGLTQYLNIQRIVGTSVWLRNKSDGWGTVTVRLSVAIGKT